MKEEFEKKVYEILKEVNLIKELEIIYIKNTYDSLFVKYEQKKIKLYVDIEEIYLKEIKLESLIFHEIYHIKQFLDNFPMIITNESKFFIIQKVVTDLYVDLELIKDDYYNEAKCLFLHRICNLEKIINKQLNNEDIYRIGLLYFESRYIFKDENIQIENIIKKINSKKVKEKIYNIYKVIFENYNENIRLYEELLKIEDNKKKILLYNNTIIV